MFLSIIISFRINKALVLVTFIIYKNASPVKVKNAAFIFLFTVNARAICLRLKTDAKL